MAGATVKVDGRNSGEVKGTPQPAKLTVTFTPEAEDLEVIYERVRQAAGNAGVVLEPNTSVEPSESFEAVHEVNGKKVSAVLTRNPYTEPPSVVLYLQLVPDQ